MSRGYTYINFYGQVLLCKESTLSVFISVSFDNKTDWV
jgi:hypothetical protein